MKIKKNVPLPNPRDLKRINPALENMEIGDCFETDQHSYAMSMRDRLRYRGIKTAIRKIDDNLWGVWRLS
jgi:hypothetical protein